MTDVRYESHDRVALITIDRAAQRNSINNAVVEGLHEAWRRFARDSDRVAILTGAGDQAFSAGMMGGFPARMPYKVGFEWAVTGDPMSAQRAYEIGFVNSLCEKGKHLDAAMRLARKVAANAPLVVQAMKLLALETLPRNPMAAHYPHRQMLQGIASSLDMTEGVTAFRDKRPPQFEGR